VKYRKEVIEMVGSLAKQYMKENGIKQSYVAEKMGLSPQVLGQILNENRKIEVQEYCDMCMALGVDISKFATEAGIYKREAPEETSTAAGA
jgi:transcriptional regulator with XRE-family HTH domain